MTSPETGVTNQKIIEKIKTISSIAKDTIIMAGKMHSAGVHGDDLTSDLPLQMIEARADLHHIGDAGYQGLAVPENILAYSTAIRGRRHTHKQMAISINK
ncbi:DUF7916 family protein [Halanaerobacter jeridensis]|uniref:DUF7916 domain-containing protein n=1 Tax=Halanaerobacter jeridensis TaxID=706427 RepID=A0A939BRF9_9FIRM|nr:hypothetical protein [Halanaerobacter jeridensis]MBM7555951.1 hypothetical protein [Halanaerobacter jeridensis]